MDEELTLHELHRLETLRKLRSVPEHVLETAWVRTAQIEAVVDAVLTVSTGGNVRALAHARHVGEWSARIATALSCELDPSLARRVGVLAELDPSTLERVAELQHVAPYVRDYQRYAIDRAQPARITSRIVAVAEEFDARIAPNDQGFSTSATSVLSAMHARADESTRSLVEALIRVLRPAKSRHIA